MIVCNVICISDFSLKTKPSHCLLFALLLFMLFFKNLYLLPAFFIQYSKYFQEFQELPGWMEIFVGVIAESRIPLHFPFLNLIEFLLQCNDAKSFPEIFQSCHCFFPFSVTVHTSILLVDLDVRHELKTGNTKQTFLSSLQTLLQIYMFILFENHARSFKLLVLNYIK